MKVSSEIPDIYYICKSKFGVNWDDGIIFTYGDTVYSKYPLDEFKVVHEGVHVVQQTSMGKEEWWDRYLKDVEFRLSQELEAYTAEVKYIKENVKDRNEKSRLIHRICKDISSAIYGNIISYQEASKLLK